jgi:hypothetical protein
MENKVKLNLTVAQPIKDYLTIQSEGFGMSISAYLTMIINQYRQQTEVMTEIAKFQTYLDQMKELMEKNDKQQRK